MKWLLTFVAMYFRLQNNPHDKHNAALFLWVMIFHGIGEGMKNLHLGLVNCWVIKCLQIVIQKKKPVAFNPSSGTNMHRRRRFSISSPHSKAVA
jgi:hypothetical protein